MQLLDSARASLGLAVLLAAGMLVIFLGVAGDALSLVSFLLRALHILAAAVWVGLIVFVNFVQLEALRTADPEGREFMHKMIVPTVAFWFRHASTATVITGALLLVPIGYVLPTLAYGSSVYVPPARAALLWSAVLAALAMWMFVHMYIWPSMQVVLGLRPGNSEAKARARTRVASFARLNLILALPVLFAMVAVAHLY